ncbi:hypothetical protein ACFLT1_09950, partial [Bacteroidota bacterium]
MYLSMANLIDGFIVNGDYLECAFRPYGGTVIHGYPSTQSVFYNTYGQAYHVNRDYIVDSRQFNWGIVTGTSGPADNVKTTPYVGALGGYDFNTSPEDFVEGEGNGDRLRPVSLYYDQLKRRFSGYNPTSRFYEVQVEVKDAFTGLTLEGVEVDLNDSLKLTDTDGKVKYSNIPQGIKIAASLENYLDYSTRTMIIDSDTVIRILLEPMSYQVSFRLLDELSGEPFQGANVYFNEVNLVTDASGKVTYEIPAGTFDYLIKKLSFQEESGSIAVVSDTLVTFFLIRTEAFMKYRLQREGIPVNYAYVTVGTDSIESNNLGISLFEHMEVNTSYDYTVRREGYLIVKGDVYLIRDTTIYIEMIPDTGGNSISPTG